MEDNTEKLYDELAQECGEVITDSDSVKTIEDAEEVKTVVENAQKSVNHFAYGDGGPVPGENISQKIADSVEIDKNTAVDNMIQQAAMLKAEKEAKEYAETRKLTPAERAQKKKDVIDYLMYQQEEAYFTKNHYIMDGRTKRGTRKRLERMYDKGRFKNFGTTNLND